MNSRFIKYVQTSHILALVAAEGSFSKTAILLNVHQTAISHRVKSLEDALGFQLFKRSTRKLTPTAAGKKLCDTAMATIQEMQKTFNQVTQDKTDNAIRLTTVSSLAMKWFLPMMADAKLKNINLALQVQDSLVDLAAGEADVGIRFGPGPYPDLYQAHLHKVSIQPVASPSYVAKHNIDPNKTGDQIFDVLNDRMAELEAKVGFSWGNYVTTMGEEKTHQKRPVSLIDRTDLTLHAAINGLGVALGRSFIVEEDIANGFLVSLGKPVIIQSSYWLVATHDFARTAKFKKFEKWLKDHIAKNDYL